MLLAFKISLITYNKPVALNISQKSRFSDALSNPFE